MRDSLFRLCRMKVNRSKPKLTHHVLLAREVLPHLRQLAVFRDLAGEEGNLAHVLRQVFPRHVASAAGPRWANDALALANDRSGAKGTPGRFDQKIALGVVEELVDNIYWRMGVDELWDIVSNESEKRKARDALMRKFYHT